MAIEATGVENVMEEVAHFWQLRKFQFIEEATDFWMDAVAPKECLGDEDPNLRNPRRAKYDKNADVIGYNLRLPANIHRLLKRHCMETNESMNNVVLVALYRDMKNWEDLAPCPHCGAILPVGAQFCPDCGKEI